MAATYIRREYGADAWEVRNGKLGVHLTVIEYQVDSATGRTKRGARKIILAEDLDVGQAAHLVRDLLGALLGYAEDLELRCAQKGEPQ